MSWHSRRRRTRWIETIGAVSIAVDALPVFLQRAGESLSLARREYQARALGPFWDAVHAAMQDFGLFNQNTRGVRSLSREYETFRRQFSGDDRDLSDTLYMPAAIPDPRVLLRELDAVLRLGQTDVEFALILEQRRMQESNILGFQTVGDAIAHLRGTVEAGYLDAVG